MDITLNDRLKQFYLDYNESMIDAANRILQDEYLAQDVCHDVFVKLSEEWVLLEMSEKNRKKCLLVAATNKAIDYKRKMSHTCGENFPCEECGKEEVLYDVVTDYLEFHKSFLNKILLELRRHKKNWYMILVKSEIYHEPVELIAKDLNMSVSMVKMSKYRAKNWLKKKFGEEYESLY